VNVSDEHTKSLWMRTKVAYDAPTLEGKQRCDTVVVGSGIAGLSAAHELSKAGQSVIVVDRGPVAGG
jgi:monoamine oxidase